MYSCLVADDNPIERDLLLLHLSKIKNIQVVADCADGLEAALILQRQEIDIVLSDVEMPDLSGIGLVKSLKKAPVFIFISSYPEYAAESYDLDVVDYIVKPASFDRVLKAVNKAIEYLEIKKLAIVKKDPVAASQSVDVLPGISEIGNTVRPEEHFFIKDSNGYTKLKVADIWYIESMGDFSKIYTVQKESHVVLVSLKNIEKQMSQDIFRRVHKQYIVNIMQIVSINPNSITLSNRQVIPLSSSYRQLIQETIIDKNLLKRYQAG